MVVTASFIHTSIQQVFIECLTLGMECQRTETVSAVTELTAQPALCSLPMLSPSLVHEICLPEALSGSPGPSDPAPPPLGTCYLICKMDQGTHRPSALLSVGSAQLLARGFAVVTLIITIFWKGRAPASCNHGS